MKTYDEIKALIKSLAQSQGSYGRILRDMNDQENYDPNYKQEVEQYFKDCKDDLDIILEIEGGH